MFEIRISTDLCKKDSLYPATCPVAVLLQKEKATISKISEDHLER